METKPTIKLTGMDGNVFGIMGAANREIIKWNRNNSKNQIDKDVFMKEMQSGDYDHAIQTVMKYFEVS